MNTLSNLSRRTPSHMVSGSQRCFSLISPDEFSSRKNVYNKKVTELRKQWAADYKKEQELALEKKRQEVERIILQKAIRLRTKREDSAARLALKKHNNERAEFFYKEHLAKLKVVRSKKGDIQKKRFDALVRSLEAESRYWVTPENMDAKITEELFSRPCTTGVVTKSSEFWRNYARCTNINRLLFGVLPEMKDEDTINDVILERTQAERATKEDIMGTLNSMIGTGEDREKFDELVEDFSAFTGSVGGTKRKPVNYTVTPDLDKMKKDDLLNLFEKGENDFEDQLLHEKIDTLLGGEGEGGAALPCEDKEDSDDEDLGISENDFHLDESPALVAEHPRGDVPLAPSEVPVQEASMQEEEEEEAYESAEPSAVEALIEDLEYLEDEDEDALRGVYQKIKQRMMNKSRIE